MTTTDTPDTTTTAALEAAEQAGRAAAIADAEDAGPLATIAADPEPGDEWDHGRVLASMGAAPTDDAAADELVEAWVDGYRRQWPRTADEVARAWWAPESRWPDEWEAESASVARRVARRLVDAAPEGEAAAVEYADGAQLVSDPESGRACLLRVV
jgi:hypothetical protein